MSDLNPKKLSTNIYLQNFQIKNQPTQRYKKYISQVSRSPENRLKYHTLKIRGCLLIAQFAHYSPPKNYEKREKCFTFSLIFSIKISCTNKIFSRRTTLIQQKQK
jgi:hypothetical protein